MDNEASNDLKAALTKHNLSYQLVPPHLPYGVMRPSELFAHSKAISWLAWQLVIPTSQSQSGIAFSSKLN
jgi:hypothetical protein